MARNYWGYRIDTQNASKITPLFEEELSELLYEVGTTAFLKQEVSL